MKTVASAMIAAAILMAVSARDGAAQPAAQATPPAAGPAASAPLRSDVPDTLMFTIDELNEIKDRISSGSVNEDRAGSDIFNDPTLFLGSILYYGPKEWVIWVNGVPVGPDDEFQSFQVTDITPQYVQLLVPLSAQGMRPVRLEPNQTFITESGVIVEGPFP
ncbi:MAG: hypothetical protein SFV21_10905 [Rhodospirillaceae bacterium]|nr:hypothetical protein [Rhodospirillaceae bacterium]